MLHMLGIHPWTSPAISKRRSLDRAVIKADTLPALTRTSSEQILNAAEVAGLQTRCP